MHPAMLAHLAGLAVTALMAGPPEETESSGEPAGPV